MPRLILTTEQGAQASVQSQAMGVAGVQDATASATLNGVIVNVSEVTTQTRQDLANLPNVTGVFDDIQAVPAVAGGDDVEDFLNRVRELRGEDEVPPTFETEPTRPGRPQPDGGEIALPLPAMEAEPVPSATGQIQNATDALEYMGIPELHAQGIRGENIISVIIDTGSCDDTIRQDRMLEGASVSPDSDNPWEMIVEHGGMSTGIMAGDETTPGIEVGVLPESDVFPIRSTLAASELIQAQDILVQMANRQDKTIVVNNSWGFPQCSGLCDHPVTQAINNASSHPQIIQVFAAGNNADGVTGCGQACDGSTPGIVGPNSLSNVITVGATGHDADPTAVQPYSNRGAEGTVACGSRKPDLSAPVFGLMPWGCTSRNMGNGGGTSAASPMVAGAVGLLVDQAGGLTTSQARQQLRETATNVGPSGFDACSGAGNVQVVEAAEEPTPAPEQPGEPSQARSAASIAVGGLAWGLGLAAVRELIS